MSRETFEKVNGEDTSWLLEHLSSIDGAVDVLFETGSITVEKDGKTYVVWLDAREER